MKRQKTLHRFAAVAAVLLTLCLVFMMPVGADAVDNCPGLCNHVAAIDDKHYDSLQDAVNAATEGSKDKLVEIKLLQEGGEVSGPGIAIGSGSISETGVTSDDVKAQYIKIDFNGCTYNVTSLVGSSGSVTNCFQLRSGSTVYLTNGGITVSETVKSSDSSSVYGDGYSLQGQPKGSGMIIQNYANLTLENMVLDGSGLSFEGEENYVLSNNCGNVAIIGNTKITAKDGDYAFDSCHYNGYPIPTVTVFSGTITGTVLMDGGEIVVYGGTFTDPTVLNYLGYSAGTGSIEVFVKLQKDFQITSTITIDDEASVILDMNGNTITGTGFTDKEGEDRHLFTVARRSGLVILNSGNTDSRISSDNSGISVQNGGMFIAGDVSIFDESENIPSTQKKIIFDVKDTGIRAYGTDKETYDDVSTVVYLDDKTKINTDGYGIAIFGPSNDNTKCYGVVVLADGEITGTHPSSGTYYGTTGITTSGNIESGDSVILLGPNAKITAVTGNSNNVGYNDAPAIMANGYAMWMIVGSTLEGDEAISMKAGELFILDGTFKATGQYYDPSETNNNGSEMTGAALSVTNTYVTGSGKDGVKIFIMGGDFESKYGHAVFSGKSNEAKDTGDVLKDFAVIGIDLLSESLESVWGDLDDDTKNLIASLGFTEEDILSALKDSIPTFKSGANKASIQISGTMSGGDIGIAVVSGKYSTDVSKYVPEGFVSVPVEDGTQYEVIIQPEDAVVVVPEVPGEVVKKDDGSSIIRNIDTSTQTVKSTTVDGNSAVIIEPKTDSSDVTFEIIGAKIEEDGSVTVPEDADIKVKYPTTSVGQGGTFINLTVSIDDIAGPIPVIDFALKPEVKNAIGEQAEVIAMLSAVGNGNTNLGSETGAIEITFIVPASVVDSLGGVSKLAVFHVKGTAVSDIPIVSITKIGTEYHIVVKADGFSTYALGIKPTVDTGNNGGGSATDTGSGNYQYYPRDVPASGIISFGTSKVVTGMELPAGSDGTVTLNIKPTFTMPENGFYAFEIDAPGYNTDAKINGGLSFQIPVSALEAAGFTAKDIVLFHGTAGEAGKITWEALPTNLVKNENGIAYYKAAINGCSPFYIGFVKDGSIINTEVVEPVTPPTETPDVPNTPGTLPPTDTPDTPETPASPAPILAVLAGLGAVAALRRK